jgi:hypothetical protein
MKKASIWILLAFALGFLIMNLTGCDLAGITIDARIDSFIDDLNFDRNNVYTNFHPTQTSDYDSLKNVALTIEPVFPASGIIYSRGTLDTSIPSSVTTVISGGGGWGSKNAVFVMVKDGSTWYINDLYLDAALIWQ